jgi:hypothetical protein
MPSASVLKRWPFADGAAGGTAPCQMTMSLGGQLLARRGVMCRQGGMLLCVPGPNELGDLIAEAAESEAAVAAPGSLLGP